MKSLVIARRRRDRRAQRMCVSDGILLEFRKICDARVFDPKLFRIVVRMAGKVGCGSIRQWSMPFAERAAHK